MSVVIVTGMHRSGTSMLARMVYHLGVPLGERLYGATVNNPYGHFEDKDFMEFHMALLERCCGHNWLVDHAPPFTEQDREQAKVIISSRQHLPLWGWKCPRTALFLDEWDRLLDQPLYIFIWRRCAEVISSATRRSRRELNPVTAFRKADGSLRRRLFEAKKAHSYIRKYTVCWLLYNHGLLAFMQAAPDRCLLYYVDDLLMQPNLLHDGLRHRGDWPLPEAVDLTPLVDRELLQSGASDSVIPRGYRTEVSEVERALLAASRRRM